MGTQPDYGAETAVQEYSISKATRRCSVSDRELEPGEDYISAIKPDGEGVRRVDIAATEWTESVDDIIGWWRCRMPNKAERKLKPAPTGVLLDTLSELLEHPESQELSYLLALMLMRRRVLKEEEIADEQTSGEYWNLVCNADKRVWTVPLIETPASDLNQYREQLQDLLFTEE